MMKNLLMTVVLASSLSLMTACSESQYTPAVGQQAYNPNQYPANNPNVLPNQQYPNQQLPNQQYPVQPNVMNQPCGQAQLNRPCNTIPGVQANAQFQYQLSAYAYLSKGNSCQPMVVAKSSCQCGGAGQSACVTRYVKKRFKLKNCKPSSCNSCIVERVVQEVTTTEEVTTTTTTAAASNSTSDRKVMDLTLQEDKDVEANRLANKTSTAANNTSTAANNTSTAANNTSTAANNTSTAANNTSTAANNTSTAANNTSTAANNTSTAAAPLPLPASYEYTLDGDDARAIYERLAIQKDKKNKNIRRGDNIECEADVVFLGKNTYVCRFSVQFQPAPGLVVGALLQKMYPGQSGDAIKPFKAQYPEVASHTHNVFKAEGSAEALIFLPEPKDAEALSPANILAQMPGDLLRDQALDAAGKIRANLKTSGNLKCYTTLNLGEKYNVTKCYVKMQIQFGTGIKTDANADL